MLIKKESFRLTCSECLKLLMMGLLFSSSSLFLFMSFTYMDSGIASTILFTYPIFVAFIMAVFFHEHVSILTVLSIAIAFVGISMLYQGEGGKALSGIGVVLVILSALTYAVYMVGINKSSLRSMSGFKLTFYSMLFGLVLYIVRLKGGAELQQLTNMQQITNASLLALFPTVISLVLIARSIQVIGATPAAILGALEPLTALFVSVAVFGGILTSKNIFGIFLILLSVILIASGKYLWQKIRHVKS